MKMMFSSKTGGAAALAIALWSILSLCTACDKDVRQFKGAYSSKTSGSLVLRKAISAEQDSLLLPDTLTVSLSPESGQMRISEIKDDQDGYNLLVSVNLLGGDALSFRAKADGDDITLETTPHERYLQANISGNLKMTLGVTTGGSGRIYDDVIVFALDYQGGGHYLNVPYVIIDSHVDCIATSNE